MKKGEKKRIKEIEVERRGKEFKYYPELTDPNFYEKIYTKKEFYKNKIPKNTKTTQEICNARLFTLAPQQEFLRNYLSPDTPYNGILIYHGTGVGKSCSAIQIAEGFKEIMRRIHADDKRKILVLVGPRVLPSFREEIYDIKKEFKKHRPDDIVQCTGNEYSLNNEQYTGLTTTQKKNESSRLVKSVYKFYGYEQFGNELMNEIDWNGKLNTLTDYQKDAIRKKYQNRILIIDEIHNIKSDSGTVDLRKVPPILQAVIRYGENIKLVLMSATPMYDNAGEIIYILNLLLENDGREPIRRDEIFDGEDNLKPGGIDKLREVSKGYISYLRGDNPIVFPIKLEPEQARTPKIIYDIYGKEIAPENRLQKIRLYMCNMSPYQYEQYLKKLKSKEQNFIENNDTNVNNNERKRVENRGEKQFANSILRPLSNIILPNRNNEATKPERDGAYQSVDNGQGAFVVETGMGRSGDGKKGRRRTYQFRYQSHVRYDKGKVNEAPFLDEKYLKRYSVKFYEALMNIKHGKGICYVFSEFIWGGVLPFAMMLEQNGFERYRVEGELPLLDYGKKRLPVCALCGLEQLNRVHENEGMEGYHEFRRAKYVLVTGDTNISLMQTDNLINLINDSNNKFGEEVKVIIGTKTTGEGLDFKRIRQVHILEPWFNLSRLDQITGRGSRYCSHKDLPKEDQNVEVFYYAIEPPESASKVERETETIDTRIYRIAEMKDRKIKAVEFVLKQAAVDCALNKNGNVFDFEGERLEMVSSTGRKVRVSLGDVNGSRECDYRDCYYNCVWEPERGKKYDINIDTYNERFAKTDIINCKRIVKNMFKYGYVYELDDLVHEIRKEMKHLELRFMYIAITQMINNINEPLYDMYDRKGYLIYRGPYYVYQPLEFNYLKAPLRYRMVPFKEKTYKFNLESVLEGENIEEVKKEEKVDVMEKIIKIMEKIQPIIVSNDRDKDYILLSMIVDKLGDEEKNNLIRKVIMDYNSSNKRMTNAYYPMLMRFFKPLLLYRNRDLELGKRDDKDELIGYYYVGYDVEDKNVIKHLRIYCYNKETNVITECNKEVRNRIKMNMSIRLRKESKNEYNKIRGIMVFKDGKYVFKVFDGTRDTEALTLKMEKSKRSEVKGKECSHHNLNELNDLVKKLRIDVKESQKKSLCTFIEYYLRDYDLKKRDGKVWFINSLDNMKQIENWR